MAMQRVARDAGQDVPVNVAGHVIVDDVLNAFNVQAAACNIRSDKDIIVAILEILQGFLAHVLALAAMQHTHAEI